MFAGLGRARGRAGAPAKSSGSRYFLQIFLRGGIDTILTADPKSRSQVEPSVDVPYDSSKIVSAGDFGLGPVLAPLAPFADRMAVLRGVLTKTANHETGEFQAARLRTRVSPRHPSPLDIIGAARDTQAVGCMRLGHITNRDATPWSLSEGRISDPSAPPNPFPGFPPSTKMFDGLEKDELRLLEELHHKQRQQLLLDPSPTNRRTAANLQEVVGFYRRLAEIPAFAPKHPPFGLRGDLERALWLFRNDVARTVYVRNADFDSHTNNLQIQTTNGGAAFGALAEFLGECSRTPIPTGGMLLDQLTVIVCSELGRFPRLNTFAGKDHFPEVPVLLIGAGIAGGHAYGATGRMMEALPISPKTGKVLASGRKMTLDQVGSTVLRLGGLDPLHYGFVEPPLSFALRS